VDGVSEFYVVLRMSAGVRIWRLVTKPLFKLLDALGSKIHEKNLRRSFKHPIVRGCGRDSVRLYENGRSVIVSCELMSGRTGVDRVIYRDCPLKWDDTGKPLAPEEKDHVFRTVGDYFDSKGVRWKS
jgi:hypothetical protein